MSIYERYGRKTEQLEQAMEQYLKTLSLLRAIKDGEVNIEDVNVLADGWEVKKAVSEG